MAPDCGHPDENHQTFPGSCSPVWKGLNVTSFLVDHGAEVHRPLLCLVYWLPLCEFVKVAYWQEVTWPSGFLHRSEAAILSSNINVYQALVSAPRGPRLRHMLSFCACLMEKALELMKTSLKAWSTNAGIESFCFYCSAAHVRSHVRIQMRNICSQIGFYTQEISCVLMNRSHGYADSTEVMFRGAVHSAPQNYNTTKMSFSTSPFWIVLTLLTLLL